MATGVDLCKDFLTCTICYDVYAVPKSLPCLHTFCLHCLSSYIAAEEDNFGVRRKGCFPCPICRALTHPPSPSKPLHRWAADFKTNFYICNLMSALKVGDDKAEHRVGSEEIVSGVQSTSANVSRPSRVFSPSDHSATLNLHTDPPERHGSAPLPTMSTFDDSSSHLNFENYSEDGILITNLPEPLSRKSYACVRSLSASMPCDKGEPKLYAICVVDDVIVTLDFVNNRLKTFFNWRAVLDVNVLKDSLDFPHKPRSLTKISKSQVAVTLPSRREIYIVQVKPVLKVISSRHTAKRYKHIAESGSGHLIAVTPRLPSWSDRSLSPVDIVNYDGITLRSIDINPNLRGQDISLIDVSNSGLIHLVNSSDNMVVCITQDGHELYRYVQNESANDTFQCLNSLCCLYDDLYLTDFDSNEVYEIKSDCSLPVSREKILSAKDGIKKPTDVHVEPDGTIFVACWDGFVRVYSVKEKPSILKKPEETAKASIPRKPEGTDTAPIPKKTKDTAEPCAVRQLQETTV